LISGIFVIYETNSGISVICHCFYSIYICSNYRIELQNIYFTDIFILPNRLTPD
jgi:hypothetical protein